MSEQQATRDLAWTGDAVLALFAREWILAQPGIPPTERSEVFKAMTSNQFLVSLGEPTAVEAAIGREYRENGLDAAFEHIRECLLPIFLKQRANRQRGTQGKKK